MENLWQHKPNLQVFGRAEGDRMQVLFGAEKKERLNENKNTGLPERGRILQMGQKIQMDKLELMASTEPPRSGSEA